MSKNLDKIIIDSISEFLNEETTINTILDKISRVGIDKLTDFEKDVLAKASEHSKIEDDKVKWLNDKYSDLRAVEDERLSFGVPKKYILYLDDKDEMVFSYDVKYKILYVSYDDIKRNLGQHFNAEVFKDWFEETYGVEVKKISSYFRNIEMAESVITGVSPSPFGGSKNAEYRRSIEMFEQIYKEKGLYYALAFLYDSQYTNEDLLGMMEILKPGKGKLSDLK